MNSLVTGGRGFIGSHLVDALVERGDHVLVIDNGMTGSNVNPAAFDVIADIRGCRFLAAYMAGIDRVFHMAAIARTPWCIDDPVLCYETNVMGTLRVLEAARASKVRRVVLSSSNVALAFPTPYWSTKRALEDLVRVYSELYGLSVIGLRYSNVYGKRQREDGPSPNVFAALRKQKRELGHLVITGDGEQSRDFTHVSDIVKGNLLAAASEWCGVLDLCTGRNHTMNDVAALFGAPVKYVPDRPGDIKHIYQDRLAALETLGWKAAVRLEDGIEDVLE